MVAVRDTNPRRQEVSSERLKKDSAGQKNRRSLYSATTHRARIDAREQDNRLRSVPCWDDDLVAGNNATPACGFKSRAELVCSFVRRLRNTNEIPGGGYATTDGSLDDRRRAITQHRSITFLQPGIFQQNPALGGVTEELNRPNSSRWFCNDNAFERAMSNGTYRKLRGFSAGAGTCERLSFAAA